MIFFELKKLEKQRHRCYEELRERIEREKKMKAVSEELELQKNLMVSGMDFSTFAVSVCKQMKWQTRETSFHERLILSNFHSRPPWLTHGESAYFTPHRVKYPRYGQQEILLSSLDLSVINTTRKLIR